MLTGAGGQVGAEVARALAGRVELLAFDHASLDLADAEAIRARVREIRPDAIVNAAAYTAVDRAQAETDAAHAVNALAPAVLAEEARRCRAVLLHYSTDYVFDGAKPGPYVEEDPVAPLNVYGSTKLEGERAIARSGCDHIVLRTQWVYGPHGRNFLLTMLRLGEERDELRVVDDQRGAPTSSLQLARLTSGLLGAATGEPSAASLERLRASSGLYHATASGETSWCRFARAIFEDAIGVSRRPRVIAISSAEYPTPARRPANSVLSCEKLANTFGLRIEAWRDGMREVLSALGRR